VTLAEVVVVAVRCNIAWVEARVGLTEADAQLVDELAPLGVRVTPRQLKRWRASGLLPTPTQVSAGRGKGRRSVSYPAGTAQLVAALADMLRDGWSLRHVAFGLFARGHEVTEAALKQSYRAVIQDFHEHVMLLGDADPADGADRLARRMLPRAKRNPLGRILIQRTGKRGARTASAIEDALAAVSGLIFADAAPSEDGENAIIKVYGTPDDTPAELRTLSFPSLERLLEDTSLDEFRRARDFRSRNIAVAARISELQETSGFPLIAAGLSDWNSNDEFSQAFGVLATAQILRTHPDYEQQLQEIELALSRVK
jgi:hypothetical protein